MQKKDKLNKKIGERAAEVYKSGKKNCIYNTSKCQSVISFDI
jgi:hypothetical protein